MYIVVYFLTQLKEKRSLKQKEYDCSLCGAKFETRLELITHKKEFHGIV